MDFARLTSLPDELLSMSLLDFPHAAPYLSHFPTSITYASDHSSTSHLFLRPYPWYDIFTLYGLEMMLQLVPLDPRSREAASYYG